MNELTPHAGQILLFRGRGFLSTLIRWQTRGKYSHAAIRVNEDECVEAWQGAGVRLKKITDWSNVDIFRVPATERQRIVAVSFAGQQIGKKYDYLGVLRFLSRRHCNDVQRWFCSELVFAAFKHAGVDLLHRIAPWEVSPAVLSTSPFLFATNKG